MRRRNLYLRSLVVPLAHIVGSYCVVGFWFIDNYGASGHPFGGWLAPAFAIEDLLKDAVSFNTYDHSAKLVLAMYWMSYLLPVAAILILGEFMVRRLKPVHSK